MRFRLRLCELAGTVSCAVYLAVFLARLCIQIYIRSMPGVSFRVYIAAHTCSAVHASIFHTARPMLQPILRNFQLFPFNFLVQYVSLHVIKKMKITTTAQNTQTRHVQCNALQNVNAKREPIVRSFNASKTYLKTAVLLQLS